MSNHNMFASRQAQTHHNLGYLATDVLNLPRIHPSRSRNP